MLKMQHTTITLDEISQPIKVNPFAWERMGL